MKSETPVLSLQQKSDGWWLRISTPEVDACIHLDIKCSPIVDRVLEAANMSQAQLELPLGTTVRS